ncbi:hypothetical protein HN51_036607 [Arachis hypogaea]
MTWKVREEYSTKFDGSSILKETDIGRHVNRLRKHSSNDVRRLVKLLVRKWKEIVVEWVRLNQPGGTASLMADGDSPPLKTTQNGHHRFKALFLILHTRQIHTMNGSSGSDCNTSEAEPKPKMIPCKEALPKPTPPPSVPTPSIAFQNCLNPPNVVANITEDRENKEIEILTRRGLLRQGSSFKKTTKRLKMVEFLNKVVGECEKKKEESVGATAVVGDGEE